MAWQRCNWLKYFEVQQKSITSIHTSAKQRQGESFGPADKVASIFNNLNDEGFGQMRSTMVETVIPIIHCLGWDIIRSSEDGPCYFILGIKHLEMVPGLI